MKDLDDYFALQAKIYEYFEYTEGWRIIPLFSSREYFWRIDLMAGLVYFAADKEWLKENSENGYVNSIYTNRHLSKWVYRAKDYTMVCVDTHTDGNKLLQVFDNKKECL